jgi:hypothetical protein
MKSGISVSDGGRAAPDFRLWIRILPEDAIAQMRPEEMYTERGASPGARASDLTSVFDQSRVGDCGVWGPG